MKKCAKNSLIIFITILVITSTGNGQNSNYSAHKTVQEFYRAHFQRGDRMYFSLENIRRKRKWFTRNLYRLMLNEFKREEEYGKTHNHPPEKSYFAGDVFTDSESFPQVYRVTDSVQSKSKATVTVIVYWNDNIVGTMKRKVRLILCRKNQQWLIDDVLYEDGQNLVKKLNRPVYR